MPFSKKTLVAAVLALSLFSTPSARAKSNGWEYLFLITTMAGMLATTGYLDANDDIQSAQSLVDEAYTGQGEKLEALAGAFGKSVEAVADTIVHLEKDGRISAENPKAMAEVLAVELAK